MKKKLLLALFLSSMATNISALDLPEEAKEALNNSGQVKVLWSYYQQNFGRLTAVFTLTKNNRAELEEALVNYPPEDEVSFFYN